MLDYAILPDRGSNPLLQWWKVLSVHSKLILTRRWEKCVVAVVGDWGRSVRINEFFFLIEGPSKRLAEQKRYLLMHACLLVK